MPTDEPATPRPWRYQGWEGKRPDRGAYILGGGPENSMSEHMVGAALPQPITNRAECEANARLIIRAVNAHDDLLAAARAALAWMNWWESPESQVPAEFWKSMPPAHSHEVVTQLESAIARAERPDTKEA